MVDELEFYIMDSEDPCRSDEEFLEDDSTEHGCNYCDSKGWCKRPDYKKCNYSFNHVNGIGCLNFL